MWCYPGGNRLPTDLPKSAYLLNMKAKSNRKFLYHDLLAATYPTNMAVSFFQRCWTWAIFSMKNPLRVHVKIIFGTLHFRQTFSTQKYILHCRWVAVFSRTKFDGGRGKLMTSLSLMESSCAMMWSWPWKRDSAWRNFADSPNWAFLNTVTSLEFVS